MKKYKSPGRLVPLNERVERGLSETETKMSFEILKLFGSENNDLNKSALTKTEKQLFSKFISGTTKIKPHC